MTPQSITICFIIFVSLLITGYDIFAAYQWGTTSTISDVVRGWVQQVPLLPWIILAIMIILWGHLFGGMLLK